MLLVRTDGGGGSQYFVTAAVSNSAILWGNFILDGVRVCPVLRITGGRAARSVAFSDAEKAGITSAPDASGQ